MGPNGSDSFGYESVGFVVRPEVTKAHRAVWKGLGRAGTWWSGAERVALAAEARSTRLQRGDPPWMRTPAITGGLPDAALVAVRKVSADAAQIDQNWAAEAIGSLGAGLYVELVAVAATVAVIDTFAEALGIELATLPEAEDGEPDRTIPANVGPAGAYVPLEIPWSGANIGRALSLVPQQNNMFRSLLGTMYAGGPGRGFTTLVWEGPLNRPQIELLAARVSALNECFY
jgi:hypothetical protein